MDVTTFLSSLNLYHSKMRIVKKTRVNVLHCRLYEFDISIHIFEFDIISILKDVTHDNR